MANLAVTILLFELQSTFVQTPHFVFSVEFVLLVLRSKVNVVQVLVSMPSV